MTAAISPNFASAACSQQLSLQLHTARQIVEDARKLSLTLNCDLADGQVQREPGAVLAKPLHLSADADDLGAAGRKVA
jgi:hypothetical protein